VLRQIRRRSAVPIILLTARTEQPDRIAGLDAGADDYLSKPFGPHELVARVRAVLRRTDNPSSHISPPVQFGELTLDSQRREVRNGDESIELTSVEFAILDVLMRSPGRIVSRSELSAVLYQRDTTPFERAIDVHISHLRKKLDSNGSVSIRSIRGIGYTLIGKKEDA
jgi:two-component system, OmpR family, response regulator CpxR